MDYSLVDAYRWNDAYSNRSLRFGAEPSEAARLTFGYLSETRTAGRLLDVGSGEGRDTLFFAARGFDVTAFDVSLIGLDSLRRQAALASLEERVHVLQGSVRNGLPFEDASFDVCYSHMLLCMDFSFEEIAALNREVARVLKPGGLHAFTVRTTDDPDFGVGVHRGENRYEDDGFTVHFFDGSMIDRLLDGAFARVAITGFEEGSLPRRLALILARRLPAQA